MTNEVIEKRRVLGLKNFKYYMRYLVDLSAVWAAVLKSKDIPLSDRGVSWEQIKEIDEAINAWLLINVPVIKNI
jgi:hypothetical protein